MQPGFEPGCLVQALRCSALDRCATHEQRLLARPTFPDLQPLLMRLGGDQADLFIKSVGKTCQ